MANIKTHGYTEDKRLCDNDTKTRRSLMPQSIIPSIVIGDIQGNPCTLLRTLNSHQLIMSQHPNECIKRAELLYEEDQVNLNRNFFIQWEKCISKIQVKPCQITLLGNLVATTGNNDIFMLSVLHQIKKYLADNLKIVVSYRDLFFLHTVKLNSLTPQTKYPNRPTGDIKAKRAYEILNDAMSQWAFDRIIDPNDTIANRLLDGIQLLTRPNDKEIPRHKSISSLRHLFESIDLVDFNELDKLDSYIDAYKSALVPIAFQSSNKFTDSTLSFEHAVWRSQHEFQQILAKNTNQLILNYLDSAVGEAPPADTITEEKQQNYAPLQEAQGVIMASTNITPNNLVTLLDLYSGMKGTPAYNLESVNELHIIQPSERNRFEQFGQYSDNPINSTTFLAPSANKVSMELIAVNNRTLLNHIKYITEQSITRVSNRKKKQQLAMHLSLIEIQLSKTNIPDRRIKHLLTMLSNMLKVKSGALQSKTHAHYSPVLMRLKNIISLHKQSSEIDEEKSHSERKSSKQALLNDTTGGERSNKTLIQDVIHQSTIIVSNQLRLFPSTNRKRLSLKTAVDELAKQGEIISTLKDDKVTLKEIMKTKELIHNVTQSLALHRFCISTLCLKPNSYYICASNLDNITDELRQRNFKLNQPALNEALKQNKTNN